MSFGPGGQSVTADNAKVTKVNSFCLFRASFSHQGAMTTTIETEDGRTFKKTAYGINVTVPGRYQIKWGANGPKVTGPEKDKVKVP